MVVLYRTISPSFKMCSSIMALLVHFMTWCSVSLVAGAALVPRTTSNVNCTVSFLFLLRLKILAELSQFDDLAADSTINEYDSLGFTNTDVLADTAAGQLILFDGPNAAHPMAGSLTGTTQSYRSIDPSSVSVG